MNKINFASDIDDRKSLFHLQETLINVNHAAARNPTQLHVLEFRSACAFLLQLSAEIDQIDRQRNRKSINKATRRKRRHVSVVRVDVLTLIKETQTAFDSTYQFIAVGGQNAVRILNDVYRDGFLSLHCHGSPFARHIPADRLAGTTTRGNRKLISEA